MEQNPNDVYFSYVFVAIAIYLFFVAIKQTFQKGNSYKTEVIAGKFIFKPSNESFKLSSLASLSMLFAIGTNPQTQNRIDLVLFFVSMAVIFMFIDAKINNKELF